MSRTEMPVVISEHTGTTYTFKAGDWGAVHTNRGASGNIAYTLPAATTVPAGTFLYIFAVAAGTVTVTLANSIVADNDAAASSVTWSQAGEIIGWGARYLSSGTLWLYTPFIPSIAATQAIGA